MAAGKNGGKKALYVSGVDRSMAYRFRSRGYKVLECHLVSKKYKGLMDLVVTHVKAARVHVEALKKVVSGAFKEVNMTMWRHRCQVRGSPTVMLQVAFREPTEDLLQGEVGSILDKFSAAVSANHGKELDNVKHAVGMNKAKDIATIYINVGSKAFAEKIANQHEPTLDGMPWALADHSVVTLHTLQRSSKPDAYGHSTPDSYPSSLSDKEGTGVLPPVALPATWQYHPAVPQRSPEPDAYSHSTPDSHPNSLSDEEGMAPLTPFVALLAYSYQHNPYSWETCVSLNVPQDL